MKVASRSDATGRGKRVLVTGLTGFTGSYVARELIAAGYDVVGLTHTDGHSVNLCDRKAMLATISGMELDAVVHLAAISFVAHGDVDAIYRVNVVGTRNLLEALEKAAAKPRVVVLASSANVYGNAEVEPITEETPPSPMNDYAVSKLAMEYMARLWAERLPLVILRPFNYTGVGQGLQFLIPKVVDHYRRGAREIELGNIDVVRDFLDVRDVAAFYRRVVDAAPVGATLNVCSGQGRSLKQIIGALAQVAGYQIEVRQNPDFVRANEVRRLVGSATLASEIAGGISPRPLEETLRWMYSAS